MFTSANKNLQILQSNQQATFYLQLHLLGMTRPAEDCKSKADVKSQEDDKKSPERTESQTDTENDEKPLEIDTSCDKTEANISPEASDTSTSAASGQKRSASDDKLSPTPSKKVRTKPQPQTIENMKEHLDKNTIDKLTTITLLHWLKGNSVHCTTRDKKAVLIQKVRNFYSEQQEQETQVQSAS